MTAPAPQLSPRSSLKATRDYVVLQHHVLPDDDFARASQDVFELLRAAQLQHPGKKRGLVLTIEGHKGDRVGYDEDFFEFQQEFMLGTMGKFLTWVQMPLVGKLVNPAPQSDELPDRLRIAGAASPS